MADKDSNIAKKGAVNRGCAGLFFFLMLVMGGAWGAGLGVFVWVLEDAKTTIEALEEFRPNIGSKVYSSDGVMLGQFTIEERQLVPLNEMPLHLVKAFLATEDHTFYAHKGVRPDAILNAAFQGLQTGNFRGASTITQQVVRNIEDLSVGKEVTPERKIREMITALQVEREFTKDEILELYLNQIFLGISAYGVEAASQQYFGKSCRELTIAEAATMAGLTRAPNANEPIHNPVNAKTRRDIVLGQMLDPENAFITQAQYDAAMAEDMDASVITPEERLEREKAGEGVWSPSKFKAPYFAEEVRKFIYDKFNKEEVLEQGMEINTTIDMRMQRAAEKALLEALDRFDEKKLAWLTKVGREEEFVPVSGALVCIDNREGSQGFVRAMVGGRDFDTVKFNSATQAKRLIGSSIKPFVWAAAIASGMTPSTIIVDAPYVRVNSAGTVWAPKNFDGKFHGAMPIRQALERSINIVSIKLVEQLGAPYVRSYLEGCGIQTDPQQGLTIALGTPHVTVMEMCSAYSTFANGGKRYSPILITDIKDRDGHTRYDYNANPQVEEAMPADVAFVVNHMLQGVATPFPGGGYSPTGARTHVINRPRGGKTGTTNDSRDAWFAGFTPELTCVVWLGYADNRPLGEGRDRDGLTFTGGHQAATVWIEFIKAAEDGMPVKDFAVPDNIEFVEIDRRTGYRGGKYKEAYIKGNGPPSYAAPAPAEEAIVVDEVAPLESL
jgi:penicillin-binding protein 1A